MRTDITAVVAVFAASAAAHATPPAASSEERAVVAAMTESAAGWNAGDVTRFMNIYSDAPGTSFVTSRGILRGKAAMIDSYRKRYDFTDLAKRGRLSFETVDFRKLGPGNALYIARYTLSYPGGKTDSGLTSLVFARQRGEWKIVADHSS